MKKLIVMAALAASTAAIGTAANATVVTTTVNIAVPNNIDGVYVNVVTGATGVGIAGYDINPYNNGAGLTFFSASAAGTGTVSTGGTASGTAVARDLTPGFVVGSTAATGDTYVNGQALGTLFQVGGNHILGFSFLNEATGLINYGYALFTTSTGTGTNLGFPATLVSYSYENGGGSITVAGVPEASSWAMMLMGLGMVGGVMRHRARARVSRVTFA